MFRLALHTKGAVSGLIIVFQMLFSLFTDENGEVQRVTLASQPIEYRSLDRNTYTLKDIPIYTY